MDMMDMLDAEEIIKLLAPRRQPCVSLTLPTHRTGKETEQDPIRFKNLLKSTEKSLAAAGLRSLQIQRLMQRARNLLDDKLFWLHMGDGLAVFMSPGDFHLYRLPLALEESTVVSDHYWIKPLLPLLRMSGSFYVLALSQNSMRLLTGTSHSIKQVPLPEDVPRSLEEALKYDVFDNQLQFHTFAPVSRGQKERTAIYHGHGAGLDEAVIKNEILQYFQQVDRGLQRVLHNEGKAPLILATVEFLQPIYREVNSYPNLLDERIAGNPDGLSDLELHDQGWRIAADYYRQLEDEALAQYNRLKGTPRASHETEEIVQAAPTNRIWHLFVDLTKPAWGKQHQDSGEVEVHNKPLPGDLDLLEYAAAQVLLNRGTLHPLASQEMPEPRPMLAVFRY